MIKKLNSAGPKLSLVERLLESKEAEDKAKAEARAAAKPPKPRSKFIFTAKEACQNPKYLPLAVWADQQFGAFAPHQNTLLRWVHEGRIHPRPTKIGKYWFVRPSAEYIPD